MVEKGGVNTMKKLSKILAAWLVLTLCMTTFAATTALAAQKVTVTSDEANLRSGPGLDYGIKEPLEEGDKATYLDSKKKDDRGVVWYKVNYDGTKGWISSRVSKLSSSGKTVKTTGSVHIRASASRSGKILGAVGKGVKLSYRGKTAKDSRGVKWYAVTYKGKKGWVSSKYAKLN